MKGISEISFKIRLTPKRSLIAVLVASILAFISTKCEMPKEDILKLYNEIRKILPIGKNEFLNEFDNQLNQRIINDPKLLEYKVRREVDGAIRDYEFQEERNRVINMKNQNILKEINKDKYNKLQKLIVENAVYYEFADGTMGIRGAWVTPDPREMPLE
jgi:signal transduction histidine kinase